MRYDSIYSIVNDIIEKIGGDSTIKFDSVYSQAKYIAEMYGASQDTKWSSIYEILLYILDNYTPPTVECTATFNIGDYTSGTTPSSITVESGQTITLPSNSGFTKEGYTFDGWTDGDNLYSAGDDYIMTSNITFEAVWLEVFAGLTFTALEDNCAIAMNHYGNDTVDLYYSINGNSWVQWDGNSEIDVDSGDTISIKSSGLHSDTSESKYSAFVMTGYFNAYGNIMSLVDNGTCTATTIPSDYYFYRLFFNCKTLKTSPELPATVLTKYCYCEMFLSCEGLTETPELPATAVENYCYSDMFRNCYNLTTVNELPATTLAICCYYRMFEKCTSLVNLPETLPATSMKAGCYQQMFLNCTSLTISPLINCLGYIPDYTFHGMFNGCTSLNVIKTEFNNCWVDSIRGMMAWTYGVASTGDFYKLGNYNFSTGVNGIPTGWTVHTSLDD